MERRPEDSSGDYEYDQAHEQSASEAHPPAPARRAAPAGRRPPEPDGDMSYDEAHDF